MLAGIDRIIDWILSFIHQLNPFVIIKEYEKGVMLRLGKFFKNIPPGLSLRIPFIDEVHSCIYKANTMHIADMNVTTQDSKTILVGVMIEYEIANARTYLLEFNETESNAHDIFRGIVADYLTDITWEEVKLKTTLTKIKNKLKGDAERMGIEILQVKFTDICMSRVFKLFNER